jgi:hypothetical protein
LDKLRTNQRDQSTRLPNRRVVPATIVNLIDLESAARSVSIPVLADPRMRYHAASAICRVDV